MYIMKCRKQGFKNVIHQEEDEQEVNHLCEEASMPIEDVIAKYSTENGEDTL